MQQRAEGWGSSATCTRPPARPAATPWPACSPLPTLHDFVSPQCRPPMARSAALLLAAALAAALLAGAAAVQPQHFDARRGLKQDPAAGDGTAPAGVGPTDPATIPAGAAAQPPVPAPTTPTQTPTAVAPAAAAATPTAAPDAAAAAAVPSPSPPAEPAAVAAAATPSPAPAAAVTAAAVPNAADQERVAAAAVTVPGDQPTPVPAEPAQVQAAADEVRRQRTAAGPLYAREQAARVWAAHVDPCNIDAVLVHSSTSLVLPQCS